MKVSKSYIDVPVTVLSSHFSTFPESPAGGRIGWSPLRVLVGSFGAGVVATVGLAYLGTFFSKSVTSLSKALSASLLTLK